MKTKLLYLREVMRTSFWFIPTLMSLAAILLAFVMISIDRNLDRDVVKALDWSYSGGSDGARAVLSTIGGSMITVAGVVFSITIVALSLASSQFGPRLLRNFIRDRANQFVLGTFIATFIYCLLVLRAVRGGDHGNFVPSISVFVGVFLALASLGVLIYFIHHVATTIQATQVISAVSEELHQSIERLFPEELGKDDEEVDDSDTASAAVARENPAAVHAKCSGYLLAIDNDSLLEIATRANLTVHLECRPGHFLIEGDTLARVWPSENLNEECDAKMARIFQFGAERTAFQDVEFGVDQLVEVAVRALSPGVNDPFTAMACIDRLAEALCKLLRRRIPSPLRYDDDGELRVIAYPVSFANVADEAFNQIRQYGRSSTAVMIRMLTALEKLGARARRPQEVAAVERHAADVMAAARSGIEDAADVSAVEERYTEFQAQLAKLN